VTPPNKLQQTPPPNQALQLVDAVDDVLQS
jgi:hypothetical protein